MHNDKYNTMPVDLQMEQGEDGYYTVVSAIPKGLNREAKEKGTLIFDRSASLPSASNSRPAPNGNVSKNVGTDAQSATENIKVPSASSVPQEQKDVERENSDIRKNIPAKTGKTVMVVTDGGKEIKVTYKLVPAKQVVTSQDVDSMKVNPKSPQELQPRDRQRASMQEQVHTMAGNLRPEDLGASRNLNQGAPIVRKDGVVLNGNGRAMAIQEAQVMCGSLMRRMASSSAVARRCHGSCTG